MSKFLLMFMGGSTTALGVTHLMTEYIGNKQSVFAHRLAYLSRIQSSDDEKPALENNSGDVTTVDKYRKFIKRYDTNVKPILTEQWNSIIRDTGLFLNSLSPRFNKFLERNL
ncbi:hypothetical protein AX774_g7848 [Zancudomyces culisetae]|uniref:Altered inheritance of mitochondria protein 5, mitochondrial n=1 Tax=Zancudomyces culisetae TaxID=1213189 RepID=A0A1R1PD17_ZANCU|nr:hypothetical protein AX774_g7848 [Zancudomyces culisetae]|eukprot:OMH78752.1 hypothetical protein AX774_g7848 [Zancudomyces culisetae]